MVQALDRLDLALLGVEVRAQHEEPVHVLRLRGDQLAALPARERERHAVSGAADEVDAAVAQHLERVVDREDRLELHVEPSRSKKPSSTRR